MTILISAILALNTFGAPSQQAIDEYLESLYRNPKETLAKIPQKTVNSSTPRFSTLDVLTGYYIDRKNSSRGYVMESGSEQKAASPMLAAPRSALNRFFGDEEIERNIDQMHNLEWTTGQTEVQPWSDSYWPIYQGGAAYRYADPRVMSMDTDWLVNFENRQWPPGPQTPQDIALLSPAEKYDMLVGDVNYGLTNYMWQQGQAYYDRHGEVETWMGFCHGWAVASMCEVRPTDIIEVTAADGQVIPFFPADIKALGTVLWSNGQFRTRFLGGRCHLKDPEVDEVGRIVDEACFDVNPATWHLTLINQVGQRGEGLILDATFDYEVWNQPITGYSYVYFNPNTRLSSEDPRQAMIDYADFEHDIFKDYRSESVRKIIGVAMQLTFVVETEPSDSSTDSVENDLTHTVTYFYDLELDDRGDIIGGEWYHNAHPDFLWAPKQDSMAVSPVDRWLEGDWNLEAGAPPQEWRTEARRSSRMGVPLAAVVRKLFESAHRAENP